MKQIVHERKLNQWLKRAALLIGLAGSLWYATPAMAQEEGRIEEVKAGEMSPNFEYPDRDGKIHSLDEFKGKYVLIDIWATYCGPCRSELPFLEKIQEKLQNKNIAFVGIATDQDKKEWTQFLDKHSLKGLQLIIDRKCISFMHRYQVITIPRYILLDTEGKVINPDMPRPSNPEFIKIIESQEKL